MLGLLLIVGSLFAIVLIGGVPAAIILRAAIWGDNKMAGGGDSPTSVPEPSLGKAIRISFLALLYISIASFVGHLVILYAMNGLPITGGNRTFQDFDQAFGISSFIEILTFFLISVLVMAGMLRFYLPTTFMLATRVALSWSLMIFALLGLLYVIVRYGLGYFVMFLPFLFVFVLIAGVPAAIILRAAIWGDNKMTGGRDSPTSVPKLSMGKAIGISFFAVFCIPIVSYFGLRVISPEALVASSWPGDLRRTDGCSGQLTSSCRTFIIILDFFLISVLVMAGMLRYYLPTRFMSATRVALSWTLMSFALLWLLYVILRQVNG